MPDKKEFGKRPPGGCIAGLEEIFRSIADHSHVGIWLLDQTGNVVYANAAAAMIWSKAPLVKKDEYQEYKAWDYESGKRIERDDWPAMRAMKTGLPQLDHLMRVERFDGDTKIVLVSAIPIFGESDQFSAVVVMNHDVTELKASESRRDELTRIVSHDLKNPLHAIQMASQLLEARVEKMEDAETREKMKQYLKIITGSTTVSLELVKDILDQEKSPKGSLRINCTEFSPAELLTSLRPIYDPLADEKGLQLEWEIDLQEPIYADKERLCQVISNLVGNAIKFTPSGGRVSVNGTHTASDILFSTTDTGPGIPRESLSRIFEKNFQCTQHPKGTGLGLYIAQMMVMAHGGKIWAESTAGKGSVVSFTIPRKK